MEGSVVNSASSVAGRGSTPSSNRQSKIVNRKLQKRNTKVLLIILALTAVWMIALHLLLFPGQGFLGISGIGMTAVALMFLNRQWLLPLAPPLPRPAVQRSIALAVVMGTGFSLMFGALGL